MAGHGEIAANWSEAALRNARRFAELLKSDAADLRGAGSADDVAGVQHVDRLEQAVEAVIQQLERPQKVNEEHTL